MTLDLRACDALGPLLPRVRSAAGPVGALPGLHLHPSRRVGGGLRQERRFPGCAGGDGLQSHRARHRDPAAATGQPQTQHVPNSRTSCALINRMGFNNKGVDHLIARLSRSRYRGIRGISIGKNFDTPIENAQDDYLACLRKVYPLRGLRRRQHFLAQHRAAARAAGARRSAKNPGRAARSARRAAAALRQTRAAAGQKSLRILARNRFPRSRRICARSRSTASSPPIPRSTAMRWADGGRRPTGRLERRPPASPVGAGDRAAAR